MTARLYKFPPRRGHLYDPLVNGATPADIRRAIADEAVDLFECLRKAGYRRGIRDDWDDFTAELRHSPESHALCGLVGFIAALTLVAAPFLAGWL